MTPVERIQVSACRIPTDFPESDGTLEWNSTTIVIVEAEAGGVRGIGYTYADTATARLIEEFLAPRVKGCDAMNVNRTWQFMLQEVRNLGQTGIAAMAISAVDACLWDLKAKILQLPLVSLLGAVREATPVYGSGGFTSYTLDQLQKQLSGWVHGGVSRVKMKIGRDPQADISRVRAAREAIGTDAELFVDANGAYRRKQALRFAERFADYGVCWFEEPVPSDDLEGLGEIRRRAPAAMDITAGEYGYNLSYFHHMLDAEAVDILQADATRCCGISGFLQVGALCAARNMRLSSHCAPALHLQACCALKPIIHMEYFHDHVRIENLLFEGTPKLRDGLLYPDMTRPGLGLELKHADARKYEI